jgi:hypothetical protein
MNRLPVIVRQHIAAFRALLVFTVLCGLIYPAVMVGFSQLAFHNQANGSMVSFNGRTFDLPLTLTPISNPTTEPRQGPAQTIVFTFDKPITGATATVTEGTATAAAPTFSGNDVIVSLTGVTNIQYVTVALSNVSSADGGSGGTGSVRVGFLTGEDFWTFVRADVFSRDFDQMALNDGTGIAGSVGARVRRGDALDA